MKFATLNRERREGESNAAAMSMEVYYHDDQDEWWCWAVFASEADRYEKRLAQVRLKSPIRLETRKSQHHYALSHAVHVYGIAYERRCWRCRQNTVQTSKKRSEGPAWHAFQSQDADPEKYEEDSLHLAQIKEVRHLTFTRVAQTIAY